MIKHFLPATVESAVRAMYRGLSLDNRLALARQLTDGDPLTTGDFIRMHKALQRRVVLFCRLGWGNDALLADARRLRGADLTPADAAIYIVNRMTDRARLERRYYPVNVLRAVRILKSELSRGEERWLLQESRSEHGLLMRQLVSWCVRRFGLERTNGPLICALTTQLKDNDQDYHPRLAARFIIFELVCMMREREELKRLNARGMDDMPAPSASRNTDRVAKEEHGSSTAGGRQTASGRRHMAEGGEA